MSKRKTCRKCKVNKDAGSFYKLARGKDGKYWYCKDCCKRINRQIYKQYNNWRMGHLQRKYNMTTTQYEDLHSKQSGKCAICGQEETAQRRGNIKKLAVDHDHVSGRLRGLLCSNCNIGLGKFKDSKEYLNSAIRYLAAHSMHNNGGPTQ